MNTTLLRAIQLLNDVGWCQYNMMQYDVNRNPTAYCALAAIHHASTTRSDEATAITLLANYLKQIYGYYVMITNWNDNFMRTKQEVITALTNAAITSA